jgi:hypothetical protein
MVIMTKLHLEAGKIGDMDLESFELLKRKREVVGLLP